MTLDQLKAEQANLEAQMKEIERQGNQLAGAIAFCKHIITLMEKENASEAQQDQGSV